MAVADYPVIYRVLDRGMQLARLLVWVSLAVFTPAGNGVAQEVTLTAQRSVAPGAEFAVQWQGPDAPGDFIAVSEPDAPAADFISYARTSKGNPVSLVAPAEGEYEVRYIVAAGLEILARAPLTVADRAALEAPVAVEAGAEVEISVSDPGDPADYVTIVAEGADELAFGPYARLRGATQVTLVAPENFGAYEVRHIRARDQSIIARAALTVQEARPAPTTDSAAATEQVETSADAIAAPEGTAASAEEAVAATATVEAAADAAATAGDTGQGAAAEVEAAATAAVAPSLMALVAVDRSSTFHVAWIGPGGDGDAIGIVPAGGSGVEVVDGQPATTSPVMLTAPDSPGNYDLVYIDGTDAVLARRELAVW